MPNNKLPHYLRAYRKRAGLSQADVAFLLGCRSGAKVSRYEHFARQPTLPVAFAYEVIFNTAARELFSGVFQESQQKILQRTQALLTSLEQSNFDRAPVRKIKALRDITVASKPEALRKA